MKNKKILAGLLATMALVGCSNQSVDNNNNASNGDTVHVSVYKGNYINLLGSENVEKLYSLNLGMEDGEVAMLGNSLSDFKFKTYDDEDFQLPETGPYVVEVMGTWCGYCQRMTSEVLQSLLDSGVKVYQYFLQADNPSIDDFYSQVGFDRPEGVTVLKGCTEFEDMLLEKDLTAVPQSFVVDESGKIALSHLGYVDYETFKTFYDYALEAKLYDTKIDGLALQEYLAQQVKIRNYINNLEEIDIPKSELD